jgi:hypothetical protein
MIIVNTEKKTIKLDIEWLEIDYKGWFNGYFKEALIDEFKLERKDYMNTLPLYSVEILREIPKGKSFLEFFHSYLGVLNKKNVAYSKAFLSEVLYVPEMRGIINNENCSPLFLLLDLNKEITLLNLVHVHNNLIKLFSTTLKKQNYKENLVTWCVFLTANRVSLLYILYKDIEKENYSLEYHCDLVIKNINILEAIAANFSDAIIDLVVSIENNPRTIVV